MRANGVLKRVLDVILKNTQHGIHPLAETLALVFDNECSLYYHRTLPSKLLLDEPYAQLPVSGAVCAVPARYTDTCHRSAARRGPRRCWRRTSTTLAPTVDSTRCWH